MRYEVVFTMSRLATETEWTESIRLVTAWLAQEQANVPRRFEGAHIQVDENEIVAKFADSEDLRIERAGTTPIWSARAGSAASARLLAGVLLCVHYACGAECLQVSGDASAGWQSAARALSAVWGREQVVRVLVPATMKADRLFYLDRGDNARLLRDFFRAALEVDAVALPDDGFSDTLLDD
jgi:hypothetical protein